MVLLIRIYVILIIFKACKNGHYDLVKMLITAGANIHLSDAYGQNALHYAVQSNNEKLCKLICLKKVNSKENSLIAKLQPKQLVLKGVPEKNNKMYDFHKDTFENKYLFQTKEILKSELINNFFERNEPEYPEEKIYNIILRYEEMDLSEIDSDGDIGLETNKIKKINKKVKNKKKKETANKLKKKKSKSKKK